jgi:hypothetical protein
MGGYTSETQQGPRRVTETTRASFFSVIITATILSRAADVDDGLRGPGPTWQCDTQAERQLPRWRGSFPSQPRKPRPVGATMYVHACARAFNAKRQAGTGSLRETNGRRARASGGARRRAVESHSHAKGQGRGGLVRNAAATSNSFFF